MITTLQILQSAFLVGAATALVIVSCRRREWRGGLLALAFVFVATAVNAVGSQFERILDFGLSEPELPPILLAISCAAASMLYWRGSTMVACAAVYRNRRFPLLFMGLLFVSILPNLARHRLLWSLLPFDGQNVTVLRELAQELVKSFGNLLLVCWAFLFLKDKRRILSRRPSSHEHLIRECPLVRVGWGGTRRACFKLGDSGFCVKFYKPSEDCEPGKMKRSIRREIGWRRFNKFRNCSSEEVYLYQRTRNSLPAEWRDRLPTVCERVFHPDYGWGVLETFYANPDGSAIIPYEFEIERLAGKPDIQKTIYRQARDFLLLLIRRRAYFHEPGNFHVQLDDRGGVSLKLIDFEPESKTAFPLEMFIPALRARKLKRKSIRYLGHIREKYNLDIRVETEIG